MIAVLDGLVLTGGGDVDPAAYGEEPDPEVGGVNPTGTPASGPCWPPPSRPTCPVLAICRGCQVLNVYLGGTLHQHLPDVVGNLDHRTCADAVFEDVDVTTVPGTRTAERLRRRATTVRCSHHQAIRDLGRDLVVTARAGDGVIEAVELPPARFVLAVQWHPEEAMDQRPFDALVQAARVYMEERSLRAPV